MADTKYRGSTGVGSSVVNALSQDLEVYVHRNQTIYHQAYKKKVYLNLT
ncbi:hypothetical protein ACVPOW_12080 [Staphylococcus aureus]